MELVNQTPYPAQLARTLLMYRDTVLAIVVAKASFDVSPPGDGATGESRVALSAEPLPISEADAETPLGNIDGDIVPTKLGCDLAVLGHAHTAGGTPVRQQTIEIEIDDWKRRILVFGDRVWSTRAGRAVATAPEPFERLPLTYDRAFGGRACAEGFETASPDNPGGRGLILLEEYVDGTPLPNIEEVDQLLTKPMQRPLPAGLAPLPRQSSIRLARGAIANVEEGTTRLLPGMFSMAHPRMMLDRYPSGRRCLVRGMTPSGTWGFRLPELRLSIAIQLGERTEELPLVVDTACVFPDYSRLFLVARCAFVYELLPRRERRITLREGLATDPPPQATLARCLADTRQALSLTPASAPLIPFDLMRELNPLTEIVESLPFCRSG